ncbi:MAG: endonuclease III [Erysipelotrichaceae bacterium]|nr:endonuclease III [Erysipelotrichaceae bacterium]
MNKVKTMRVLEYFDELYPDACCELNYRNNYELLVAVMLSAQTTDKKVNQVTTRLFEKYPDATAVAASEIRDLEEILKYLGLYKNKAKNLKALSQVLLDEFGGVVPDKIEQLQKLPGVGRKTANVVLVEGFKIPAIPVDTHVTRVAKRLGFAKVDDDVVKIEAKLQRSIPKELQVKAHSQFIFFGRYFCKAINPSCGQCELFDMCKDEIKYKRTK